ncbi:MAG: hypothetical protein V9G19_03810 [Tetrasphaera sp.]
MLTATLTPGPVIAQADFTLEVGHGPEVLATAVTVIVPASEDDYRPETQGRLSDALSAALA